MLLSDAETGCLSLGLEYTDYYVPGIYIYIVSLLAIGLFAVLGFRVVLTHSTFRRIACVWFSRVHYGIVNRLSVNCRVLPVHEYTVVGVMLTNNVAVVVVFVCLWTCVCGGDDLPFCFEFGAFVNGDVQGRRGRSMWCTPLLGAEVCVSGLYELCR